MKLGCVLEKSEASWAIPQFSSSVLWTVDSTHEERVKWKRVCVVIAQMSHVHKHSVPSSQVVMPAVVGNPAACARMESHLDQASVLPLRLTC